LHERADASARWAVDALRARGLELCVLTDEDLARVEGWSHRVGDGGADCELRFAGGDRLLGSRMRGVFNRLPFVPTPWLRRLGGADREYAVQEMQAFYLSWIHALPGSKLNRPTPQGLCGSLRHPSEWRALAARAGLPIKAFRQTSEDDPAAAWRTVAGPHAATLYVVGAQVVGPHDLEQAHGAACSRLAEAAGAALLGVRFEPADGERWRVAGASAMPDLIEGGGALVDALAGALLS
jgi:hypothetical protein